MEQTAEAPTLGQQPVRGPTRPNVAAEVGVMLNRPIDMPVDRGETLGFFESAGEFYMHETMVGNMMRYGIVPQDYRPESYDIAPGTEFNPYAYFMQNKDEFDDVEIYLANRMFDGVYSEDMFRDRANRLRTERDARERLGNANGFGMLLGGVLSFADVTTLVPGFGLINRAAKFGKIAKWATAGTYYSGIQEAALHMTQDLRTMEESAYAVAGGAVLGGGIGVFAHARNPASAMNPRSENFIFGQNSRVRMGIRAANDTMSNSVVLQPVYRNGQKFYEATMETNVARSVGAAARQANTRLLQPAAKGTLNLAQTAVKGVGVAGSTVAKALAQATPLGRTLLSRSQKTRELAELIFDRGGVLLEGDRKGIFNKSVEDDAGVTLAKFHMDVVLEFPARLERLRMRLGEIQGKVASATAEKAKDVADTVVGFGKQTLQGPSGASKQRMESFNTENSRLMEHEFEDLVDMAMRKEIPDEVLDNMLQRFGREGREAILNEAQDMAKFVHKKNLELEDELVELGMITESQRLGEDWVSPQLWNARGIRAHYAEAYEFFLELLLKDPPEEYLDDAFGIDKTTFNKLGQEEVTMTYGGETRVFTVEEGRVIKREMLEDWSGDLYNNELTAASTRLEVAQTALEEARRQAVIAARDLRKSVTEIKNASVDEAVATVKRAVERQAQRRSLSERLKLRRQKLRQEMLKEEADWNARLNKGEPNKQARAAARRQRREGKQEVRETEALLKMVENDPDVAVPEIKGLQRELTEADIKVDSAGREAVARTEGQEVTSPALRMYRDRIAKLDKEIAKLDKKIAVAEAKIEKASAIVEDAVARRKQVQELTKAKRAASKEAKRESSKARTELKRAKKGLKKTENKVPVHAYIENLLVDLSNGQRPPLSILEDSFFESARVKTRQFKLTPEQKRRAARLGILNGSLIEGLSRGYNDLAPRMAMRRVLGHLGTSEEEIMKGIEKTIRDDYQTLIDAAEKAGRTPAHIQRLKNRMKRDIDDLQNGIKRITGRINQDVNYDTLLAFGMTAAKMFNYVRYGSGFTIASQTDLANVVLASGFGTFSYRNTKAANRILGDMSSPEIKRMAMYMEKLLHNSRDIRINNMDDMRMMSGVGEYGTVKHFVTSTVDRALSGLTRTTQYASAMYFWNSRLKILAMSEMQHNLIKFMPEYEDLLKAASAGDNAAERQIAQLASLGLGQDQMARIARQMQKHSPVEVDGAFELQMHRWRETPEGRAAYDDVLVALEHVANRAIMTPGKGDTPFFMSKPFYGMLMQFQTYGFVTITRYMLPAFQRMASYGDMEAFLTLGLNLALGSSVVAIKDILREGQVKERTQAQWAYDVVDRSGLLAYTSPLLAEAMLRFGDELPSRYARERNRMTTVFGPTGGLISDVMDLNDAVAYGDGERARDTLLKFVPLHTYGQIWNIATGDEN